MRLLKLRLARDSRAPLFCHSRGKGATAALLLALLSVWAPSVAEARGTFLNFGDYVIADKESPDGLGSILRINLQNGAQQQIAKVPQFVEPRAVVPDGNETLYVIDDSSIGNERGKVIRVDLRTNSGTLVCVGGLIKQPYTMIRDRADGSLLVSDRSDAIIRVDPHTGAQSLVSSGGLLKGLLGVVQDVDGSLLVTAGSAFGTNQGGLIRVDPTTGAQTPVYHAVTGRIPVSLLIDEANRAYLLSVGSLIGQESLDRVNLSTGAMETMLEQGSLTDARAMTFDLDGSLLIGDRGAQGGFPRIYRYVPGNSDASPVSVAGMLATPMGSFVFVPEPSAAMAAALCAAFALRRSRQPVSA